VGEWKMTLAALASALRRAAFLYAAV